MNIAKMLRVPILHTYLRKSKNQEGLYAFLIRKYHQYKPKDRSHLYDSPLPYDSQVLIAYKQQGIFLKQCKRHFLNSHPTCL